MATLAQLRITNDIASKLINRYELNETEVHMDKGSVLFLEGDRSEHIYLVKSGKVRLSKTSSEGKVFFLQLKKKDDILGELSLFNGFPHQCNAEVIQDSTFLRFPRKDIENLLMYDSELAIELMRWFSKENQTILAQFRDLVFCGKEGAVFSILIKLSNEYGKTVSNGLLINRKITNQEIANYVGATRESINRILKRLIRDEIISVNTKYITIHDMQYLQRHLRCNYCPFEECTI